MTVVRKIPRKKRIEAAIEKRIFTPSSWAISTWVTLTAALALICVAFTIGVHAWHVSYWPKFNQTEIISDVLWMLIAGVLWILFLALLLVGMPFLIGGCLPGSFLQREGRIRTELDSAAPASMRFNLEQLAQLSVLWFVCLPSVFYSSSLYLSIEQKENVISAAWMAAFFLFITLGRTEISQDKNLMFGPDIKDIWRLNAPFDKRIKKLTKEVFSSWPKVFLICIFGFVASNFLGRLIPGFVAVVADTGMEIGLVIFVIALGNFCALALIYGGTRVPWPLWVGTLTLFGIILLSMSTSSLIELSRIGNVRGATMIYDQKFSGLVKKMIPSEELSPGVAVAKVDIVFSFGADVVIAKAASFSSAATCDFSWLSGEAMKNIGASKKTPVPCLALPRSAVFSLT